MSKFTVFSMQSDSIMGWIVRAKAKGLKALSAPGRFGDEIYFVKDLNGNAVKIIQNSKSGRVLDGSAFSNAQLEIVKILQECGLISMNLLSGKPFR